MSTTTKALPQPQIQMNPPHELRRPFLKWAGSKTKLVPLLANHLPANGVRYFEPFLGAGAFFLNTGYPTSLLSDANPDVIGVYEALRKCRQDFVSACRELFTVDNNQQEAFYRLRDEFNRSKDPLRRAALFVYLNRHCYNGLCRYNRKGQFNTPFGKYDRPYFPETELLCFAERLRTAELACQVSEFPLGSLGLGTLHTVTLLTRL